MAGDYNTVRSRNTVYKDFIRTELPSLHLLVRTRNITGFVINTYLVPKFGNTYP